MAGSNDKLRVLRRIPEIRFDEELRGYNKHQVDRVLENLAPLADEVDGLVDRLSEAERRAAAAEARVMESGGPAPTPAPPAAPVIPPPTSENFDETLSKTLLLAQRTADATVEEAKTDAARIRAEAEAEAQAAREALDIEVTSMRRSAEEERDAAIDQANREVAAMIDAARATIDSKVAEAEAELSESHASTRDDLVEQISSLELARDALALDVEHFEGHLASRREVIRSAIAELSDVVEDPERLRTVMPPNPVAEVPDVDALRPIEIEVTSLDTLASEVTDDAASRGLQTPDIASADPAGSDAADSPWADGETTWADDPGGEEALSSGLIIDAPEEGSVPESADDGDPTQAVPVVDDASVDDDELPMRPSQIGRIVDDQPNAAEAGIIDDVQTVGIDPADASSDPFLDELRRVTSDDDDDEALSKFLTDSDADDDAKGGWFGRRK